MKRGGFEFPDSKGSYGSVGASSGLLAFWPSGQAALPRKQLKAIPGVRPTNLVQTSKRTIALGGDHFPGLYKTFPLAGRVAE